jgi:hypothetical protein
MAKIKAAKSLIKQLETQGYQVKVKKKLAKKTFIIEAEALLLFLKERERLGLKIQDAATQALTEWAEKAKKIK